MKTAKEIIIETLQGEGLMYAYRDFADDIKDEHIEKIADKIVKNLNIRELLVAFLREYHTSMIVLAEMPDIETIVDDYLKSN